MVPHQAVRHAIADGIDVDGRIERDPPAKPLDPTRQGTVAERPEERALENTRTATSAIAIRS